MLQRSRMIALAVFLVLLASFVAADIQTEVENCGNSIACKLEVAATYHNMTVCQNLEREDLVVDCEKFVAENSVMEDASSGNNDGDKTGVVVVGMVIAVLVFIGGISFFIFKNVKRNLFVKTHKDLINYVEESLSKNLSEDEVKARLKEAGWDKKVIEEAIKEVVETKKT